MELIPPTTQSPPRRPTFRRPYEALLRPVPAVERPPLALPLWVHLLVLAGIAALAFDIGRGMWGWSYDDAFIIYRYARNIVEGHGMVYNPGEYYLGTTSAGYTLLLAGLHFVLPRLDFPALGSLISAVCIGISGAALWGLGVQTRTPLAGLLAALITTATPLTVQSWGGEMPLLTALVMSAIYCYSRGAGTATGVLLSLAVLTRQDTVLLAGLVGLHYLYTRRRIPWRAGIAGVLVMLPWLAYSWATFGSPLPGTLEAKLVQGKAGWPLYLSGTLNWLETTISPDLLPRLVVLALVAAGVITLAVLRLRRRPLDPWLLVVGWGVAFSAGYTVLRLPFYIWYTVPLGIGAGVLLAWGIAGIARLCAFLLARAVARSAGPPAESANGRPGSPRLAAVVSLGVALLLAAPIAAQVRAYDTLWYTIPRGPDLYEQLGDWFAQHGGPQASVAFLEVGKLGYYSDAHIIDLLGLVTPGASAHVIANDWDWAIQHYQPDYYIAHGCFEPQWHNVSQEAWFQAAYTPALKMDEPSRCAPRTYPLVVYERKPGAVFPTPLRPLFAQTNTQQKIPIVPSDSPEHWAGQTFSVAQPQLSALALLVTKPNRVDTGNLVLHLKRSPQDPTDLRRVVLPLANVPASETWLTFRFAPLADSAGQSYFLSLELADLPRGPAPLTVWCATDDLYAGGSRYTGANPAPGDLAFRVLVPDK